MAETIRVLLLDTGLEIEELVTAALADTEDRELLRLSRIPTLDGVEGAVERGEADILLLPLLEVPGRGVLPVVETRAAVPELPIVVVAQASDEPLAIKALQLGATDYLVLERIYGTLVSRCLRHAVEVERIRARLAEQEAEWPASLLPEREGDATAASLRAALPQRFEGLASEYRAILELAVEQALYRVEHQIDRRVARLAQRAAELWAGPRDVVEIHASVLKEKELEEGPQRIRLFAAEGRVRLLELMGHLVSYYRGLSLRRRAGWRE